MKNSGALKCPVAPDVGPLRISIEQLQGSIDHLSEAVEHQLTSHSKLLEDRRTAEIGIHVEVTRLREQVARLEARINGRPSTDQ
jgi:ubiquinone biosynthesis protein UbiJ